MSSPPVNFTPTPRPPGIPADKTVSSLIPSEGRSVLSTLNDDGSRRWLRPRVSPGRFLSARRVVAYLLIAVFTVLPLIHLRGRPLVLLDIASRRFHLFGMTFYPTDTLLLAIMMVAAFVTIFWTTALLGRVWCGWACPQTVYMEFLYRPIERFFMGAPGRAPKGWLRTSGAGTLLMYAAYLACSFFLAHTFLAYFVSWDNLSRWVFGSPGDHILGFGVIMAITAAMMFNFSYFREQLCIVACPYGRMQSVMLDPHSMIIRYDSGRGEPRGAISTRPRAVSLPVIGAGEPSASTAAPRGDCIDCKMCVTTCPTGIDIRRGLQMECIGCAQCIDACDAVMDKVRRPRGLIRYSSEAAMKGESFRVLRPRIVIYPSLLLALGTAFSLVLANTGIADVTVLRGLGQPFSMTEDHEVSNAVRVKITNRLDRSGEFTLSVKGPVGVRLITESSTLSIAPGQTVTLPGQVLAPPAAFTDGRASAVITILGPDQFAQRLPFTLLGPSGDRHEKHDVSHEHTERPK